MNGDDHFRAHIADDIRRKITHEAPINKNLIVAAHGVEESGDGDGGAHGLRQAAIFENDFLAADQIGCNAAIGGWQIVERFEICVRQRFAINQQTNLVAGVQPGGERKAIFQADLYESRIIAVVFFAAKR